MNKNVIVLAAATVAVVLGSIGSAGALSIKSGWKFPKHEASTYSCGSELGYLRRVYPEQIDSVLDEDQVSVVPVCEDEDGSLRNAGNAGALRMHIADNEAMVVALGDATYSPEDVVGVRMTGDESIILYVQSSNY